MCSQRLNCCSKVQIIQIGTLNLSMQANSSDANNLIYQKSFCWGGRGLEGWTSHEPNDNKMSRWGGGPVMNWKAIKSDDNWSRGVSVQIPSQ